MKPGDIIFWGPDRFKHFFLLIEEISLKNSSYKKFKIFSSDDSTLYVGTIMSHLLNHLSEGFWEYK